MSIKNEYSENLEQFRRRLEAEIAAGAKLPTFLQPESQDVTDDIARRSRDLRDAVLRLDKDAIAKSVHEAAAAGFNRASDVDSGAVPELDEARRQLLERLAKRKEGRGEADDKRDRPDDCP